MPDREKVIKGLLNLREAINNPEDYIHETNQAIGTIDATLALLKEQEAEIERLKTPTAGDNQIPLRW